MGENFKDFEIEGINRTREREREEDEAIYTGSQTFVRRSGATLLH